MRLYPSVSCCLLILAVIGLGSLAQAADTNAAPAATPADQPAAAGEAAKAQYGEGATNSSGDWEFPLMSYFWLPSLKADSTINQWGYRYRGFGIGSASDLTWQILGGMDYKFTKNIILNMGYRYVDLDYSHGSGADEFGIHLKAQGPIMGLTIIF
jgi:opacity protein-like surface antigen